MMFKGVARTLDIPVCVLAQANRKVEAKANRVPEKAHVSYGADNAADRITGLMCPEVYFRSGTLIECPLENRSGILMVYVVKFRNGPLGTYRVGYDIETGRLYPAPVTQEIPLVSPAYEPVTVSAGNGAEVDVPLYEDVDFGQGEFEL
jgi:hypothetical protein